MRRAALLASVLLLACGRTPDAGERAAHVSAAFTSAEAVPVELELNGAVTVDTTDLAEARALVSAQLTYTIGNLYADRSAPWLAGAEITRMVLGLDGVATYHARLPVAWGGKTVPSSYDLALPRRARRAELSTFVAKYGGTCIDPQAGLPPIDASRAFLFFRPRRAGCELSPSDVVHVTAKVNRSAPTPDRYPEYDRIWEDGVLDVVVLFGRADAVSSTGADDEGLRSYLELQTLLQGYLASLDRAAGYGAATLTDGRKVRVHSRLVAHDMSAEDAGFDAWYDEHAGDADLVVYNGHAGLGGNVRALMSKGRFRTGKYLLFAVNACDSFAYVDRTLAERRAALNPDDPNGTKYMDVLTNVLAGYFKDGPPTTMTLLRALVEPPITYRELVARLDPAQVATVTGEEDNTYAPPEAKLASAPLPAPGDWGLPPVDEDDSPAEVPAPADETKGSESPFEVPLSCATSRRATSSWSSVLLLVAALVLQRRHSARQRPAKQSRRSPHSALD